MSDWKRPPCNYCVNHIDKIMKIEYDADKDEVNQFKHRLPLAFGTKIFDDPLHAVLPSFRPVDGEDRYKAMGMVDGKLYTSVYI